jgi:hypothetical protein
MNHIVVGFPAVAFLPAVACPPAFDDIRVFAALLAFFHLSDYWNFK